jgi:hypothetical protein
MSTDHDHADAAPQPGAGARRPALPPELADFRLTLGHAFNVHITEYNEPFRVCNGRVRLCDAIALRKLVSRLELFARMLVIQLALMLLPTLKPVKPRKPAPSKAETKPTPQPTDDRPKSKPPRSDDTSDWNVSFAILLPTKPQQEENSEETESEEGASPLPAFPTPRARPDNSTCGGIPWDHPVLQDAGGAKLTRAMQRRRNAFLQRPHKEKRPPMGSIVGLSARLEAIRRVLINPNAFALRLARRFEANRIRYDQAFASVRHAYAEAKADPNRHPMWEVLPHVTDAIWRDPNPIYHQPAFDRLEDQMVDLAVMVHASLREAHRIRFTAAPP